MIVHLVVPFLLLARTVAPGPLTVPQFINRLDALESTLKTAAARDADSLAASWSGDVRIEVRGVLYDVDLEWAGGPLRAAAADPRRWPDARATVRAGIQRVRREAATAVSSEPPDRDNARRALDVVLRDRRFGRGRATDWRTLFSEAAIRWIRRLWNASLGARVGTRTLGGVLAWVLAVGAILALLVSLLNADRRRRREAALSIGRVDVRSAGGRELALEAVALVREGRFREAIRVAYRAAVRQLEEEGAWRADATRTPREYLGLLPGSHRRRPVLSRLTRAFERTWYGARPGSSADGAEILACLAELECLPRDHAI